MVLSRGYVSTKFSLDKGIRVKTGAAHPRQIFFGVKTIEKTMRGIDYIFEGLNCTLGETGASGACFYQMDHNFVNFWSYRKT